MFRITTNLRNDPLGMGYLNASQRITPDAERNDLRWRIEGVLWLAAAMTGHMPKGMFHSPMPASNDQSGGFAPIATLFSVGSFNTNDNPPTFVTGAGTGEYQALTDDSLQPATVPNDSRYFTWTFNSVAHLPTYYASIYASVFNNSPPFTTGDGPGGAPYVHVFGASPEGTIDFSNLNDFFSNVLGRSGLPKDQISPPFWGSMVSLLHGQSCSDPGTASKFSQDYPFEKPALIHGLVAALKSELNPKSDMEKQFNLSDSSDGEWATNYHWNNTGACQWRTLSQGQIGGGAVYPGFEFVTIDGIGCPLEELWNTQPPLWWRFKFGNEQSEGTTEGANFGGSGSLQGVSQINPSVVSPDARLRFALNSGAPLNDCDAAWQLTQAMAMSCLLAYDAPANLPANISEPQALTSPDQLGQLTSWLASQVKQAQTTLTHAYITQVPVAVLADALGAPGSLTSQSGAVGEHLAQTANALISVYSAWGTLQSDANSIVLAMQNAQNAIALANAEGNVTAIQTYMTQLQRKSRSPTTSRKWSRESVA